MLLDNSTYTFTTLNCKILSKEKNYSRIKHLIRPKNIREIKASFYYLQHHYAIIWQKTLLKN